MKLVLVYIVLCVTLASSYPARENVDLSDVDDFDPFGGQEPIVDTGYFDNFYPSAFYKRLQDLITSIRQSLASDGPDVIGSFGDLGEGNTTSYTKIIGNHKVEVNETEYKKNTDFGTSHVKVSFINVRPLNPDTIEPVGTSEPDAEPINRPENRDRESLESVENEIPNIDEARDMEIETFDMTNNNRPEFPQEAPMPPYKQPLRLADIENPSNDIDIFNDVDNVEPVRDLSNDIYVNDIMLADGAPLNPHAEFI